MYESFNHMRVKVVQTPTLLGPYNEIDNSSATYERVLSEAKKILLRMKLGADLLWDYFEMVGINPQDSFTADLEDKILEYLLRMELRPYGIELMHFASEENGMSDLDEVIFFIK